MRFKSRCIQHPMILEDNMPIHRPNRSWKWIFSLLILGFVCLIMAEIARADSLLAILF